MPSDDLVTIVVELDLPRSDMAKLVDVLAKAGLPWRSIETKVSEETGKATQSLSGILDTIQEVPKSTKDAILTAREAVRREQQRINKRRGRT